VKVVIAGGRNITDYNAVVKAIGESGFSIEEVVSGAATGVDSLARAEAPGT
jgi:predicted Rossmann fold nucleotide-binding protein DprA/Smf involved in DNA uptake